MVSAELNVALLAQIIWIYIGPLSCYKNNARFIIVNIIVKELEELRKLIYYNVV